MITITDAVDQAIRAHGESTYPYECCGFLLGKLGEKDKTVSDALPAQNDAIEPKERRFMITPEAYMQAEKTAMTRELDVVGFYHSHPDHPADPSQYDIDHAWPRYSYIIVSIRKAESKELKSWVLGKDRKAFDAEAIEKA